MGVVKNLLRIFIILKVSEKSIELVEKAIKEKRVESIKNFAPECDMSQKYEVLKEVRESSNDYCVVIEGGSGFPEVYTSNGNCLHPKDGDSTRKYEDFWDEIKKLSEREQKESIKKLILEIKDKHDCFLNLMDYSIEDI